jgi:hypothetical protein
LPKTLTKQLRIKSILLSALVSCLATAPGAPAGFGCSATDVSSEPIVVRAAPNVKANAVQSILKDQASSLERRDTFAAGRRGDWLEVHATGLDGWVSAVDVACRTQPGHAQDAVGKQAEEAIEALKTKNMAALARVVHPMKGLRFSPIATVDAKRDVVLTASQLGRGFADPTVRVWGYDDGSGAPIRLTFAGYFRKFVYDRDFAAVSPTYNSEDSGTEKAWEESPNAIVVGYFLPETEKVPEEHLRLVFEQHQGRWYLSGIIHDGWTI